MSTLSIFIILSIILAIFIGFKLKVNVGLCAIVFAFLFGVYFMDKSVGAVVSMWPTKLFFDLFCMMFFYAFAQQNGTLEAIARRIVYSVKGAPQLIPIALLLAVFLVAAVGPGTLITLMVMPPLVMRVVKETEMNPGLGAIIITSGTAMGGWSPVTTNATLVTRICEGLGFTNPESLNFLNHIWFNAFSIKLLTFVIGYIVFAGYRSKIGSMEKPLPLTREQKITMTIIMIMVGLLLLPSILVWMTGLPIFATMRSRFDINYISIIAAIFCIVLKLGEQKKSMSMVPWNALIMLCGVGMLVEVASASGAVKDLASNISENLSPTMIPYAVISVACFMSFFSSMTSVVIPTMFPLVANICTATGLPGTLLFSLVIMGAHQSGISPLSTAGAMAVVWVDESQRESLFIKLFVITAFAIALVYIMHMFGLVW